MAGDRLYNQRFIFKDGEVVEKYVWQSDMIKENKSVYPTRDDGEVSEIFFGEDKSSSNFPKIITKMNESEIRRDRLQRSKNHFKDKVWENLPKDDKMLFRDRKDLKM